MGRNSALGQRVVAVVERAIAVEVAGQGFVKVALERIRRLIGQLTTAYRERKVLTESIGGPQRYRRFAQ